MVPLFPLRWPSPALAAPEQAVPAARVTGGDLEPRVLLRRARLEQLSQL